MMMEGGCDDLSRTVHLPAHVDLAEIIVTPTDQAAGGHVYGDPPE